MFLLKTLILNVGWTSIIKFVWNCADDTIKKKVIESENQIDDAAFKAVDEFIKEL